MLRLSKLNGLVSQMHKCAFVSLMTKSDEEKGGGKMSTHKLLNVIGLVTIVSVIIYFMAYNHEYSKDKIISGLIFYLAATVIYFLFVYLYHKSKQGQKLVLYGLGIITLILIFLLLG